jgi:hypothetical protein
MQTIRYTERDSKIGILTRRRPEFKPGLPAPKQLNLNKLGDAGGLKFRGCRRRQKPIFESRSVYGYFSFRIVIVAEFPAAKDTVNPVATTCKVEGAEETTMTVCNTTALPALNKGLLGPTVAPFNRNWNPPSKDNVVVFPTNSTK